MNPVTWLRKTQGTPETLRVEIQELDASREAVFEPPPIPWIEERLVRVQEVLEHRTQRSALLLRKVLTPLRLEPVTVDVGRPYYRVASEVDVFAVFGPDPEFGGLDAGSNSFHQWS